MLAQKPLALDVDAARAVVEEAERRGVKVAVNQNGRWSPPWRIATLLVDAGAIGDVIGVTHLLDKPLPPLVGTHFAEIEHFTIFDHLVHWIDICRCWLDGRPVAAVRAHEYRPPNQPADLATPVAAWVEIVYEDGANAMIRVTGDVRTRRPSCPFWIHGTEGTIRGSVLVGSEFVELERDGVTTAFALEGTWNPDGFAGTLAELARAIAEDREPFNSARHNLLSLGDHARRVPLGRRGIAARRRRRRRRELRAGRRHERGARARRARPRVRGARGSSRSTASSSTSDARSSVRATGWRRSYASGPRPGWRCRASCSASTATAAASPTPIRRWRGRASTTSSARSRGRRSSEAGAILVPFFGRGELHDEADLDRAADAFRALCPNRRRRRRRALLRGHAARRRDPGARRAASHRERSAATSTSPTSSCAAWTARPRFVRSGRSSAACTSRTFASTVGDCPPGLGSVDFAESARGARRDRLRRLGRARDSAAPRPSSSRATSRSHDRCCRGSRGRSGRGSGSSRTSSVAANGTRAIETCERFGLDGAAARRAAARGMSRAAGGRSTSVVARLDDAGISIVALAGYRNLVAPDDGNAGARISTSSCAASSWRRGFGTSVVATETGTRSRDGDWEDSPENALTRGARAARRVARRARRRGRARGRRSSRSRRTVKNVLRTPVSSLGLLERFASPHLQVVLDPYNYVSHHLVAAHERLTRAFLDRFEHRFVLAHLKDIDPGGADFGTIEFGTGELRAGAVRRLPRDAAARICRSSSSICRSSTCPRRSGACSIFEQHLERRVRVPVDQVVGLGRLRERDPVRHERVDLEPAAREQLERRSRAGAGGPSRDRGAARPSRSCC